MTYNVWSLSEQNFVIGAPGLTGAGRSGRARCGSARILITGTKSAHRRADRLPLPGHVACQDRGVAGLRSPMIRRAGGLGSCEVLGAEVPAAGLRRDGVVSAPAWPCSRPRSATRPSLSL